MTSSEPAEGGERYIVRGKRGEAPEGRRRAVPEGLLLRLGAWTLSLLCLAAVGWLFIGPAHGAVLLPNGEQTFVDANGAPLAGGSVYFYIPTTTTPKTTWKDSGQSITNTNPVTLDSAGRATIYGQGTYRQVVKDAFGVTQWDQLTADGAAGNPAIWGGSATGTPSAIVVSAAGFNGTDGQVVGFRATANNLGATTLNAGTGAITVQKDLYSGPTALIAGDIVSGNDVFVVYDANSGTFHIINLIFPSSPALAGVPTAPTAAVGTNTTQIATTAFVGTAVSVVPKAHRNRLINGNFQINQRVYVSATATASQTYMLDHWRSGQAASSLTFTALNAGNNSVSVTGLVQQTIENIYIEGGAYTLSWTGTSQCREAQGNSAGAALAALSGAYSTSPLAIASITANNWAVVECNAGTLTAVQLEPGTSATAFETIPFDISLTRCWRYYEKSYPYTAAPGSVGFYDVQINQIVAAATAWRFFVPFRVPKPSSLATPTNLTVYNAAVANNQVRNFTKSTDFTATTTVTPLTGTMNGFSVSGVTPAGSAATDVVSFEWAAESEL